VIPNFRFRDRLSVTESVLCNVSYAYEFFRFRIWNDLGDAEEQKQNLTEDELESSIFASDHSADCD
jgi:hypothetical protein